MRVLTVTSVLVLAVCVLWSDPGYARQSLHADLTRQPVVIQVLPEREWTSTGIAARKGELLDISATGTVHWERRSGEVGPDGESGMPGWGVGAGGLVGRIGTSGRAFDVGARTGPLFYRNARERATHPPSPLRMPADGELQLGFKKYQPGTNHGGFAVTIRFID